MNYKFLFPIFIFYLTYFFHNNFYQNTNNYEIIKKNPVPNYFIQNNFIFSNLFLISNDLNLLNKTIINQSFSLNCPLVISVHFCNFLHCQSNIGGVIFCIDSVCSYPTFYLTFSNFYNCSSPKCGAFFITCQEATISKICCLYCSSETISSTFCLKVLSNHETLISSLIISYSIVNREETLPSIRFLEGDYHIINLNYSLNKNLKNSFICSQRAFFLFESSVFSNNYGFHVLQFTSFKECTFDMGYFYNNTFEGYMIYLKEKDNQVISFYHYIFTNNFILKNYSFNSSKYSILLADCSFDISKLNYFQLDTTIFGSDNIYNSTKTIYPWNFYNTIYCNHNINNQNNILIPINNLKYYLFIIFSIILILILLFLILIKNNKIDNITEELLLNVN